jgi:hypothetical protein
LAQKMQVGPCVPVGIQGVRLAEKLQADPYTPAGTQLQRAGVGPTAGPTGGVLTWTTFSAGMSEIPPVRTFMPAPRSPCACLFRSSVTCRGWRIY